MTVKEPQAQSVLASRKLLAAVIIFHPRSSQFQPPSILPPASASWQSLCHKRQRRTIVTSSSSSLLSRESGRSITGAQSLVLAMLGCPSQPGEGGLASHVGSHFDLGGRSGSILWALFSPSALLDTYHLQASCRTNSTPGA